MKLKPIELALIFALVIAILFGTGASAEAKELSSKLIRLHVVAASDSDEEQALKLKVRDAVLLSLEDDLNRAESREEAEGMLSARLNEIKEIAEEVIDAEGKNHKVSVSLEEEYFSTTDYETFSLPAGNYLSLRIVIGEGKGHNWWCVVFPQVCFAGVLDEEHAADIGLTEGEISLITRDNGGVKVKFRAIEFLSEVKKMLGF